MTVRKRPHAAMPPSVPPPKTWRELLARLIAHPAEKQRIADELGVSPLTLTRWVSGERDPQLKNLQRLHEVVPQSFRQVFSSLIQAEIVPTLPLHSFPSETGGTPDLPSAFYYRVLELWATASGPFRAYQIRKLVLQQAIKVLDPDILGLHITLARAVPPRSSLHKVHSLVEIMEVHTPPYEGTVRPRLRFLGSESLPGYASEQGYPAILHEMDQPDMLSLSRDGQEQSAAAYPILAGGRYAGCVQAFCLQPHYFSEARLALLEASAYLLALSFESEEFIPLSQVQLREVPAVSTEEEQQALLTFRDRVRMHKEQQRISIQQAEREVLQQFEEERFNERRS